MLISVVSPCTGHRLAGKTSVYQNRVVTPRNSNELVSAVYHLATKENEEMLSDNDAVVVTAAAGTSWTITPAGKKRKRTVCKLC